MAQPSGQQTKNLSTTIQKTKDARYHASERLNRRATWKSALLVLLSAYILLLSIFPKFVPSGSVTFLGEGVDFLTFSASLVLLILSVFLAFDEDRVRAQGLYDNAWRIGTIYHEYKHAVDRAASTGEPPPSGDEQYAQYREALEACKFRHDPIDYIGISIALDARDGQRVRFRRAMYLLRYLCDVYIWPGLRVVIPLVGITFVARLLKT